MEKMTPSERKRDGSGKGSDGPVGSAGMTHCRPGLGGDYFLALAADTLQHED